MPKVYNFNGWRIFFWSNEGTPREDIHVHVAKRIKRNATKFWILSDGTAELENNNSRIPDKELNLIQKSLELYHDDIVAKWIEHFGEEPTYRK